MTEVQTETLTLSLTADVARKLRAFAAARNGSIHNVASALLEAGIATKLSHVPAQFHRRYVEELHGPSTPEGKK